MFNIEDLRLEMQRHVHQLNQLNQKVNETVGAIKALQGLIASLENKNAAVEPQVENPVTEDVPQ